MTPQRDEGQGDPALLHHTSAGVAKNMKYIVQCCSTMQNQRGLRFKSDYLGFLHKNGCSGVLAPSAGIPRIIRIDTGSVNQAIGAADVELVGTAAFLTLLVLQEQHQSKSFLIKMLDRRGSQQESQFPAANRGFLFIKRKNPMPCSQPELPPAAGPRGRGIPHSHSCLSTRPGNSGKNVVR